MPLPRPASPKFLWADLKAFWRQRPRHQWVAGTLAIAIPIAILVMFYFDGRTNIMPGERVIFLDSWTVNRTDAEIMAKQKADLAEREAREERRRQEFQRLDENLNRLGI